VDWRQKADEGVRREVRIIGCSAPDRAVVGENVERPDPNLPTTPSYMGMIVRKPTFAWMFAAIDQRKVPIMANNDLPLPSTLCNEQTLPVLLTPTFDRLPPIHSDFFAVLETHPLQEGRVWLST
jgi:hypothetical protein